MDKQRKLKEDKMKLNTPISPESGVLIGKPDSILTRSHTQRNADAPTGK